LIERLGDDEMVSARADHSGVALVVGNLDGVHRGHQALVAEAVRVAKRRSLVPALLTFDPHPSAVVGTGAPPTLTTLDRKAELVADLGIARVVARTFTREFSAWPAERFVRELVKGRLHAEAVFLGDNFRFGAGRSGDPAALRALGDAMGFETHVAAMLFDAKGQLSSSRVRAALEAGDLADAELALGRRHSVSGIVIHGDHRGRTLGFPTANLGEVPELVPANGVYAVAVDEIDEEGAARALALGVTNVGVRPTVGGEARRTLEVHLFDVDRDLYGVRLRVHWVARLREERKFEGLEALRAQIARDAAEAKRLVAGVKVSGDGAFG
jgi:riboflavin kinase/FMN adenylyltransferase